MGKINQSENRAEVNDLAKEIWDESENVETPSDNILRKYEKEARLLLNRIEHHHVIWFKRVTLTAVSVAAVLAIVFLVSRNFQKVKPQIAYLEMSTSVGEKKQLQLSDGTKVLLNACSKIVYPSRFIGDVRRVKLKGEAFFEVTHNEGCPFIVMTKGLSVRVLGTKFDVKAYSNDKIQSVGVRQGRVQVNLPDASLRITSKEEVLYNTTTKEINKRNGNMETAMWINGNMLQFNATPIQDAVKQLERIYHCHITFAPGQKFDNLISGEHENKNLISVLKSISFVTGNIKYKIEGDHILLYHP